LLSNSNQNQSNLRVVTIYFLIFLSDSCDDMDTYKVRSAKMRTCENGQRIQCEIESAIWRCENMYKMRKCEKEFDLRFDHSVNIISV